MDPITVRTWDEKDSLTMTDDSFVINWLGQDTSFPADWVTKFTVRDPMGESWPGCVTLILADTPDAIACLESLRADVKHRKIEFPHGFQYMLAARIMQHENLIAAKERKSR